MADNKTTGQVSLFDQEVDFLAELSARDGWPDPKEFPFNQRVYLIGRTQRASIECKSGETRKFVSLSWLACRK